MASSLLSAGARGLGPVQADFFSCDIFDALPKDDLASMEHPLFSLATRPDLSILSYRHNGVEIEVTPSVKGRATIHDKDILIYCTSQLMAALNAGRSVARTLHLRAHDLLTATNRETSGDAYRRLRETFERLAGTRITTNLVQGDVEVTRGFGLIEDWEIVRKTRGGRMIQVRVTLSEWLYAAIMAKSVLTLSREYFGLRRPLERRLYELARKHCGRQPEWHISLEVLQKKAGSNSPRRVFRAMLRDVIEAGHIPDYSLTLDDNDLLRVTPQAAVLEPMQPSLGPLAEATLERARMLASGWDIYALEAEWRGMWQRSGRPKLRAPDKAFLGWLAKRLAGA
ncbi:MAG: replication initiator protein A [Cypionkella sp.]|uniref:replication initiator protein A n=1 Tax=Cypionkella sp. TaxID=2811411 RepID=UPI002722F302|nr:replication initiator protein A [Cypionkella sp.]MDO8327898.1 replication initiator protein A [Cypionkella sp.]